VGNRRDARHLSHPPLVVRSSQPGSKRGHGRQRTHVPFMSVPSSREPSLLV
jgi:hypothetical protein